MNQISMRDYLEGHSSFDAVAIALAEAKRSDMAAESRTLSDFEDPADASLTADEQASVAFHRNNYVFQTRLEATASLQANRERRKGRSTRGEPFGRHLVRVVEDGILWSLHATKGWKRQGRVGQFAISPPLISHEGWA